jgi:hypothetical protein
MKELSLMPKAGCGVTQLGLYLGVWSETLRYFTPAEELVPLPQEVAIAAILEKE